MRKSKEAKRAYLTKNKEQKKKKKEVEIEEDKGGFLDIVAGDEAERGYKGTLKRK